MHGERARRACQTSLQLRSPCCSAAAVVGREAVLSLKPARLQASPLRPFADIAGWLRQRGGVQLVVALARLSHCKFKEIGSPNTSAVVLHYSHVLSHHHPRPRRFPRVIPQPPPRAVDRRRPHRSRCRLLRGIPNWNRVAGFLYSPALELRRG